MLNMEISTNLFYSKKCIVIFTNIEFFKLVDIIDPALVILNCSYLGLL